MPIIRQLPPSVINKIAAGEVIERPASVVKELLENAVDAGSRRIDVTLERGGLELIRVADDGVGIEAAQLPLAVASHATSKIQDADDLFRVQTLGFRGEALASIAEISHLILRSRTGQDDAGAELRVNGGLLDEVVPCGCPVGTILEVRNLFFNTPVRRKFQRSAQTELGHCSEAFTRIALAYPSLHFTLRHGDRVVFDLPATESWRERIVALFGQELGNDLIWVESCEETSALRGFVANPTHSRANNRLQYLFLNGRFIRDRSLQHALGEAYRGLLLTGRFPIAFLQLELQPDSVDVNVHPTKLEVRFEDSGRVYSQLLGTIRAKFLSSDLTTRVKLAEPESSSTRIDETVVDPDFAARHQRDVASWARGDPAQEPGETKPYHLSIPAAESRQARFEFQPQPAWRPVAPFQPFPDHRIQGPLSAASEPVQATRSDSPSPPSPVPTAPARIPEARPTASTERAAPPSTRGLQVHNRYLVTETEEGMVVIDQHALHERILYEQIRERVLAGQLECQRLLVPEPVTLPPPEAAAALDAKETLQQLGIEIEPFGGDTVLVSAYPTMLAKLGPQELLRNLIELLMAGGKAPDRRDLLDEILHMVSCKAAIKAGDRLSVEEVHALIEQRHLFQDTHHCPHGRPTALVFTREELDRRFKRT